MTAGAAGIDKPRPPSRGTADVARATLPALTIGARLHRMTAALACVAVFGLLPFARR